MARVLTWHVHGNYLLYLTAAEHELVVPVEPDRRHPYGGRSGTFPWPDNLVEVAANDVPSLELDAVLYQSAPAWQRDRFELLSERQRRLPALYLEHDPPRESPFDTLHPARDGAAVIVHVTHFNRLMWDCGEARTEVIEHGVHVPADVEWTGELERGLVIVNNLATRGRRLGLDVFEDVRREVPLDLVGMGSEELGGLGEIPPPELPAFAARYRFLFNPIRWTSLGLAVCEAMHVGLPVVGLATTEMPRAIENGVSGWVDTDVGALVEHMQRLIDDPDDARRLSEGARAAARARYGIEPFARRWTELLDEVAGSSGRTASELRISPSRSTRTSTADSRTRTPLST